ncbi:MAG: hypothetical protein LQ352_001228 [Teloschistes flavicans]|nr:MAG: hypothetical protein LQ352_001228 [Teloschistes flavicans]
MKSSQSANTSSLPTPQKLQPFRFKRKHPVKSYVAIDPPSAKRPRLSTTSPSRLSRCSRRRDRDLLDQPDPKVAFRESLFDALADDEGAAYWESVYGQPIHTYSPYIFSPTNPNDPEQSKLQRMTDDEYASYVRGRMWQNSYGYITEEKQKREEGKVQRRKREEQGRDWARRVEEALKKSEERRRRAKWREVWKRYLRGWEVLLQGENWQHLEFEKGIPWPVETGRFSDVGMKQVNRFFRHAPQPKESGEEVDLITVLKVERVRWHPDKFLQRAGGRGIDRDTMTKITAVFQLIDREWCEKRDQ